MTRLLLAVMLLSGCYAQTVRITKYPSIGGDLIVIEGDQRTIDRACTSVAGKWDDGTDRPVGASVGGCYTKESNTIYLVEGATGCVWRHELCHAAGYSPETCDGMRCDK